MFPAPLLTKLSKLIPLLSSDQDGEVVAAARAIGRALATEGHDFHDLVAKLSTPPRVAPGAFGFRAPEQKPPSKGLYTKDGCLRPWTQVAAEILERNLTIPKRYGGRSLLPHQLDLLEKIKRGETTVQFHEIAVKRIDDLMRAAAEAQAAAQKKAA